MKTIMYYCDNNVELKMSVELFFPGAALWFSTSIEGSYHAMVKSQGKTRDKMYR
jgi:hypothetical protein